MPAVALVPVPLTIPKPADADTFSREVGRNCTPDIALVNLVSELLESSRTVQENSVNETQSAVEFSLCVQVGPVVKLRYGCALPPVKSTMLPVAPNASVSTALSCLVKLLPTRMVLISPCAVATPISLICAAVVSCRRQ